MKIYTIKNLSLQITKIILSKIILSKTILLKIILFIIMFVVVACTPTARFTSNKTTSLSTSTSRIESKSTSPKAAEISSNQLKGLASYYHNKFEGRKTASGEIFNQKLYTAAHKELPFGTLVKVTRTSNGKSVIVKINDRGPFVENRIIDLSYIAAFEIGLTTDGVAEVIIEILE